MLGGCITLFAGVVLTLAAVATDTIVAFLIGNVVAGLGFGLAFLGAFRTLSGLAAPAERAGMITAIYIVSYVAFSVPVVIAGIAVTSDGLHDVALAYAAVVAGLAALGAAASVPAVHPTGSSQTPPQPAERTSRPVRELCRCASTAGSLRELHTCLGVSESGRLPDLAAPDCLPQSRPLAACLLVRGCEETGHRPIGRGTASAS
jgi:MFS family permease